MNPIIRNLLSVVRRFKLAAILNVSGLSVAFAAFRDLSFEMVRLCNMSYQFLIFN